MSLTERSRMVLLDCTLIGVPVLDCACLVGVSVGVSADLRPGPVLEESRNSSVTCRPSLLLSWERVSCVCGATV